MTIENEKNIMNLKNRSEEPFFGHLKMGGTNPEGNEINVNSMYILKDGQPYIPIMGEFHFSRFPDEYWEEEILKMKAGGITVVSSYIFWIHHEEIEGQFDWTGRRNLRKFVQLCAKHGMHVLARIGPWCHGEVRNGGFPDWIKKKGFKPRRNNDEYLACVRKLYSEIAKQLQGLYYKDGGPVIGIQLENELTMLPEHLLTLKNMAIELGMQAPLYTATAWAGNKPGGSWIPLDEMLPVFGGYPDGAWDKRLTKVSPGWLYYFHHIRNDVFIGNDIFGYGSSLDPSVCDDINIKRYPYATCELGGGMCNSYHRRPVISADDVAAMILTKIGNGNNLVGYYVYHGGSNPIGKLSTLQESKDTKYPNDYTVISYDYQAPIGEFGQLRPLYGKLNSIHMFVNDFGNILAPMVSVIPDNAPKNIEDTTTLRYAVRVKDNKGFVFINNYERNSVLKSHKDVKMHLELEKETLEFPREGLNVDSGSYFIIPFNMDMDGIRLKYSTTQLLCKLNVNSDETYFFYQPEGVKSEYAFVNNGISGIKVENCSKNEESELIYISDLKPGKDCVIEITTLSGKVIRIVTLTQKQAENAKKLDIKGNTYLIISNTGVIYDGEKVLIFSSNKKDMEFCVYPELRNSITKDIKYSIVSEGIFQKYSFEIAEQAIDIKYEIKKNSTFKSEYYKYLFLEESLENEILECDVKIPDLDIDGLNEAYLEVDYSGDMLQVYIGDKLVADEFYKGTKFEIGLKRFKEELKNGTMRFIISPLKKDAQIFLETWPEFGNKETLAIINDIKVVPQYEVDIL